MKVRKMRELLKEQNASASVFLDEINDLNCGLVKVAEQGNKVVLYSIAEVNGKPDTYKPSCIVSTMTLFICLKKFPDDYDVVMASGDPVLFVVSRVNDNDSVVLEDENVNDLSSELEARFATAVEEQWDELYFFMDLLDTGFALADINKYCPEKYEYSKKFMEEHGLISDVIDDETGEKYDPKDFVIETCPVCGREEVIRIKGVSRCRCGYPLAPCSVCESYDYATCPYGCNGTEEDTEKPCDHDALPDSIQEKLYALL